MQRVFLVLATMVCLTACTLNSPQYIVITATFTPSISAGETPLPESYSEDPLNSDPTRFLAPVSSENEYIVQLGDTLSAIAAAYGVSLEALLAINNIANPNIISVGQVILLPAPPTEETNSFKIIPDNRLVRGPGSRSFDIASFINQQTGYIRSASDTIDDTLFSAAEVIDRVSREFSVDARLLLALLEYKSNWLSNPNPDDTLKAFPIQGHESTDGIDRHGLYLQLSWAANQLNSAYYGWKEEGLTTLEFADHTRLGYASGLNAGTVALQYFLSLNNTFLGWTPQVTPDGFYKVYAAYFGDPFDGPSSVLVPVGLIQPTLEFPFPSGETWFFTGGPHGGWGTGSAWAAIDFAPPDDRPDGSPACFVSQFWATAAAPGIIARSGDGVVVLDLDGDGDESTGWTLLYLHIASEGRIEMGKAVNTGDLIGHPSCEGGFSNGTHMHFARRYNGEWLPVTCDVCAPGSEIPPLVLSGWTVIGYSHQEYQGYMTKGGETRRAEQGRLILDNRVSW